VDRAKAELDDIFCDALELTTPSERAAYLDRACGEDADLRQRVERLLEAHGKADNFLAAPPAAAGATSDGPGGGAVGTVVGPYQLLEPVGEGGMGAVFLARQTEPVRRQVALKVIKPGMDSRPVVARFEAERQALAVMDHPNIAKVFDAGTMPDGRPFFVMELVKGVPITRFCDENRLTPRQRLELFIPICQAVQHAHQKGIIHRDLKPSNVLVALYDDKAVPKVIDFGIAKAVGPQLTEQTLHTGLGTVVGTAEYMSPEQASLNRLDIDTRSDVYALGVLLYELLTGTTPLEHRRVMEAGLLEALRLIREEEAPALGSRLGTAEDLASIAARRGLEPAKLTKLVRGDLNWVVMKALEKDRNCRYETANGFAMDVHRYLADEPVLACPPSVGYRLRKFGRRNRRPLATAALLGVILLAGVGGVAASLGWAARDREAARKESLRDRAERKAILEGKVVHALDAAADHYRRGVLADAKAAVQQADGFLASAGENEDLRRRLRQWQTDLAVVDRLERIRLGRSVGTNRNAAGQPPRGLRVVSTVEWLGELSDGTAADRAYREAFLDYGLDPAASDSDEAARRIRNAAIRDQLAVALDDWVLAKREAGLAGWEELLAVAGRADPDPWRDRLRATLRLPSWQAVNAIEDLARDPNALSQPPAATLLLARLLNGAGKSAAAIEALRRAQQRQPADFWINQELAWTVRPTRPEDAIGYLRAALALRPQSPLAHFGLGAVLDGQDRFAEAEREFTAGLHLDPDNASAHMLLGFHWQTHAGRLDQAEGEFSAAARLQPNDAANHYRLGQCLEQLNKFVEAESAYRRAILLAPRAEGYRECLGEVLLAQGRTTDAEAAFTEALRLQPKYAPAAAALARVGRLKTLAEAVRLRPEDARAHFLLANGFMTERHLAGAEFQFREAIRLKPNAAAAHGSLINVLARQGKLDMAEAHFQATLPLHKDFPVICHALGNAWAESEKWDKAAAVYAEGLNAKPGYEWVWQAWAVLRLNAGDAAGYRLACQQLLERFDQPPWQARIARTCLLAPAGVGDLQRISKLLDQAVATAPSGPKRWERHSQQARGMVEYRAGRYAAAVKQVRDWPAPEGGAVASDAAALAVLAMAHGRLGQVREARAALAEARSFLASEKPGSPRSRLAGNGWTDWLQGQILCREAEQVLKEAPGAKNPQAPEEKKAKPR
jgi:serine/threonine protein kinase/tetratricopeptide (TPR) repeat protein